jgi:transposase
MSVARLLITAVVVENPPVREVAATYGVSKSWLYELLARYGSEVRPPSNRTHDVPGPPRLHWRARSPS